MVASWKPWTDEENNLLLELAESKFSAQEVFDSGKFPGRTMDAIRVQLQRLGASPSTRENKPTIVQSVEPAANALTLEQVMKLFSSAYEQICQTNKVDKYVLERFRIIFQAARDYAPLMAHYEKWDKIDKKLQELTAAVAELQAAKPHKENEEKPNNQLT